jgi:hypothetical protein
MNVKTRFDNGQKVKHHRYGTGSVHRQEIVVTGNKRLGNLQKKIMVTVYFDKVLPEEDFGANAGHILTFDECFITAVV